MKFTWIRSRKTIKDTDWHHWHHFGWCEDLDKSNSFISYNTNKNWIFPVFSIEREIQEPQSSATFKLAERWRYIRKLLIREVTHKEPLQPPSGLSSFQAVLPDLTILSNLTAITSSTMRGKLLCWVVFINSSRAKKSKNRVSHSLSPRVKNLTAIKRNRFAIFGNPGGRVARQSRRVKAPSQILDRHDYHSMTRVSK